MIVPRWPPDVTMTKSSYFPGGTNVLSAASASSGVSPRCWMISSSGFPLGAAWLTPTASPPGPRTSKATPPTIAAPISNALVVRMRISSARRRPPPSLLGPGATGVPAAGSASGRTIPAGGSRGHEWDSERWDGSITLRWTAPARRRAPCSRSASVSRKMPPVAETEASFATPPAGALWRAEPFRLFFPLGVLLGWVGVGHWLLYALGLAATYSCQFHGLVQVESFLMAFATGFLMTALPRRTQTAAPSAVEMVVAAAALVATTGAAAFERWALAEAAYATLFLLLLGFAVRRFVGRAARRRPPAAFVMIPIGALAGLAGAALVA